MIRVEFASWILARKLGLPHDKTIFGTKPKLSSTFFKVFCHAENLFWAPIYIESKILHFKIFLLNFSKLKIISRLNSLASICVVDNFELHFLSWIGWIGSKNFMVFFLLRTIKFFFRQNMGLSDLIRLFDQNLGFHVKLYFIEFAYNKRGSMTLKKLSIKNLIILLSQWWFFQCKYVTDKHHSNSQPIYQLTVRCIFFVRDTQTDCSAKSQKPWLYWFDRCSHALYACVRAYYNRFS